MLVYRVAYKESRDGDLPRGPYTMSGLPEEIRDQIEVMRWKHTDERHPGPYKDPMLIDIFSAERCGFDSLDNLYGWFEGYVEMLHRAGFRLYVYDVPDAEVRIGKYGQTLFRASCAKEVRVSDLDLNYGKVAA